MGSKQCSSVTGGRLSFGHKGLAGDELVSIAIERTAFNEASCSGGTGHTKQDDAVIARSLLLLLPAAITER